MAVTEKTKTHTEAPREAESKGEVAVIKAARLPWHPLIGERFGVDKSGWRTLTDAIYPAAKTTDAVILALSYCKARKLDPFKHPVHIVPIYDKEQGKYVESVWPGIAEHRTTAFRTGQYAGADAATFGPTITRTFEGETKQGVQKVEMRFPEWCQMTLYRLIGSNRVPMPGPRVYWLETYSHIGRTDLPNDMWQKRPSGQIEKCAEAAALRKAFPEELGGELTAEEAEGLDAPTMEDVSPPRPKRDDFKPAPIEVTEAVMAGEAPPASPRQFTPMIWPAPTADRNAWRGACKTAIEEATMTKTETDLLAWQEANAEGIRSLMEHQNDLYQYLGDKLTAHNEKLGTAA